MPRQALSVEQLIIEQGHERGALLCTSNRAAAEWGIRFGDARLATEAKDAYLRPGNRTFR